MFEFRLPKQLKTRRVKRSNEDIEPHEVFLDNLAQKKERELGISEKKIEVPLSRIILQSFLFFAVFLILALFAKTFQFQVFENKKYLALAQENKFIVHSIQTSRGVVYDSTGQQLVFNKLSFDLVLDKRNLPKENSKKENILKEVADITKISPPDLEKKIGEQDDPLVLISKNLDYQTLILLKTEQDELTGFSIQENTVRDYQDGKTFAHLIGYTSRVTAEELKENPGEYSSFDYVGRVGAEKSYEEILRKKAGKLQIERDVFGNQISKKIISLPESGQSLVLWLDANLQKKAEEVLERTMEQIKAKTASVVALDPKTGGVLSLISLPSFDNNLFNKDADVETLKSLLSDPKQPLFNRAIAGQFPTGSTIKPLIATAALEEKLISASKTVDCQGKITIPHRYNPDIVYTYRDWTTHGITDMRKAIAESCDVYFYTIGGGYKDQKGLGPSKIKKYLELFGWGDKTQVDIPGENKGFIPSPEWKQQIKKEAWYDGDTYNISIGQGDMGVTPLQVTTAFAAVANGGTLYQPQVVKKIIDNDKNVIKDFSPKILRQNFVNPESLKVVREGMRWAVSGEESPQASSVILNSLPVKVAAKTGTAQTSRVEVYDNWVTVFAPYDNPQIVLTILFEDVKNTQMAALPAAKEILNWYFTENIKTTD